LKIELPIIAETNYYKILSATMIMDVYLLIRLKRPIIGRIADMLRDKF